jgi:hypothetical protein
MSKIEFKTQIVDGVLTIPQEYKDLKNSVVHVILEEDLKDTEQIDRRKKDQEINLIDRRGSNLQAIVDDAKENILDFSELKIECFLSVNPLEYQRRLRDGK